LTKKKQLRKRKGRTRGVIFNQVRPPQGRKPDKNTGGKKKIDCQVARERGKHKMAEKNLKDRKCRKEPFVIEKRGALGKFSFAQEKYLGIGRGNGGVPKKQAGKATGDCHQKGNRTGL